MVKIAKNLSGEKFTRLYVFQRDLTYPRGVNRWLCRCDCGVVKSIDARKLKSGNTKSCGCLNKELSSQRQKNNNTGGRGVSHPLYGIRGKNNPNYGKRKKNPKTKEMQIIRMRSDYAIWRADVFLRDCYTCKKCGVIGGSLNAHHIFSFGKYESLRFNVDNGITFCMFCHKQFHDIFGRKDNNPDQLEVYLHVKNHTE